MTDKKDYQKRLDEALLSFKKANYREAIIKFKTLEVEFTHFLVNWYLGHSYFRIYDYLSALENIKISIKLKSEDLLNLNFLGEIYLNLNDHKNAILNFKKALQINQKDVQTLANLARSFFETGKFKEAEKFYKSIVKTDTGNMFSNYQLVKLDKKNLTDELNNYIINNEDSLNSENKIYAKLILAEYAKDKKNYKSELDNLILAHSIFLKKKKLAASQEYNYFNNLLPKFIKKSIGHEFEINCKAKPIFIMGLPRSGTTLVENIILSANKTIKSGEEAGVVGKVFYSKQLIKDYDSNELNLNFNFSRSDFAELKKSIHKQYLQLGIDVDKNIFTDKSLENFLYIEIIHKIFPNAKFIYCKRNKLANFLGILKVFLPNLLWSHSLERIETIMNIYDSKFKNISKEKKINIKVVKLEDLSDDPIKITKDLYNFLDLKWNEDVLNLNLTKTKTIKTLSNIQSRQRIKKHNLNYLDDYITHLKKLGINI
jgi:hypothetical protein